MLYVSGRMVNNVLYFRDIVLLTGQLANFAEKQYYTLLWIQTLNSKSKCEYKFVSNLEKTTDRCEFNLTSKVCTSKYCRLKSNWFTTQCS